MNSTPLSIEMFPLRARRTDPQTSKDAAKHALSAKAAGERKAIYESLKAGDKTAKQVATDTGIDYIEVQRRKSEIAGIGPTGARLDGCEVWGLVK